MGHNVRKPLSPGEIDRLGCLVPERCLDIFSNLRGTLFKFFFFIILPVMRCVGREITPIWPVEQRVCLMCEDIEHFIMDCPSYGVHRARMFLWVERETDDAGTSLPPSGLRTLGKREQLLILLGKRFGTKESEDLVDKHVERFLRKC
jgi:hypothetical protein